MDMEFLDCNLNYGPQTAGKDLKCCADIDDLVKHMKNAGIAGGLVIKTIKEAVLANTSLAEELKNTINNKDNDIRDSLKGVWILLPSCTGEIPPPHNLPELMKQNNIGALTINPRANKYLPKKTVIGDYMEMAQERKIPVLLNTSRGLTLDQADNIMQDFPDLTVILTLDDCWPNDRYLRPFLDAYPNLCLDMTYMLTDSWLKDMKKKYPADKILFGSGFPVSYMGAHMLVIKHAEISEEDKRKIAGGNLKKLLREARYD